MTHDPSLPTPLDQVPLGWEPVAYLGTDLPEAQRILEDQRDRPEASLLAIDAGGELSVWICRRPLWPLRRMESRR